MNKRSFKDPTRVFLFGFFILIGLVGSAQKNNWELAKKKLGVEVYTKEAPGWPLKAYLARGIINAPFDSVAKYMHDFSLRKEWYPNCSTSDIIHTLGQKEMIVYMVVDAPWPTSDRDIVFKVIADTSDDKNTITYQVKALAHYIPVKEDYVRINRSIGYWKVHKINGQKTEVITEGRAETGGEVPSWLANMFVEDSPLESILNLRGKLEK